MFLHEPQKIDEKIKRLFITYQLITRLFSFVYSLWNINVVFERKCNHNKGHVRTWKRKLLIATLFLSTMTSRVFWSQYLYTEIYFVFLKLLISG